MQEKRMEVEDEAGITRRDDGRLVVRATAKDPDKGKIVEKQRTMPEGAMLPEAVEMREALKEQIRTPKEPEPDAATSSSENQAPQTIRTVGDYVDEWFERMTATWDENTATLNAYILEEWVQPVIGHVPIGQLSRAHAVGWVSKIDNATKDDGSGYAKSTKRGWWAICRQMLQDLCAEFERYDVTKRVKGPRKEGGKSRERRTLTEKQLRAFLEAFQESYPHRYGEVLTLATTGMRSSEMYGLLWDVIDYDEMLITVKRAAPKGDLKHKTKTGGHRTVPMLEALAVELKAHRRRLLEEPGRLEQNLVFPSTKGTPRYASSIRKPMYRVSDVVCDFRVGPQVLRRSFNTLMLHRGVPEGVVQSMIGHSSSGMTRLYRKVQPEQQREWHTAGMDVIGG